MRIKPSFYLLLLVALCAHVSCKTSTKKDKQTSSATPLPSNQPDLGAPTRPPLDASRTSVTSSDGKTSEAPIREFFENWLAAQNKGDFAAYERLYAERFTGIKRVGARTSYFDRKSWMNDRRPMLRPGVRVEAADPVIRGAGSLSRLRFRQSFAAGTFQDVGMKELLIVREDGGLRISREEMLASSLADAETGPEAHPLWFVHQGDVYLTKGVPEGAISGPPRLQPSAFPWTYAAERPLDPTRLPSTLRAYEDQTILVYRVDGSTCKSQITKLRARVAGTPHFGVVLDWEGRNGKVASSDQRAAELWEIAGNSDAFVVGTLARECADGVWATPNGPENIGYLALPADESTRVVALEIFAGLPAYQAVQREFVEYGGNPTTPWESSGGFVSVTGIAGSRPHFVVVSATAGRGCGDFGNALTASLLIDFDVTPPKLLRHNILESNQDVLQLRRAVDLDGDGTRELLMGPSGSRFEFSIFKLDGSGGTVSPTTIFEVPYWDCPC